MAKSQDSTQPKEPTTNEQVIKLLKKNEFFLFKENAPLVDPLVDQIISLMNKDDFDPNIIIKVILLISTKEIPIIEFIILRGNKKLFDALLAKKPSVENETLLNILTYLHNKEKIYQLTKLITSGYYDSFKDSNGNNILAIVLQNKNSFEDNDFIQVIKYILSQNISINEKNTKDIPAFYYLCDVKNEDLINKILQKETPDFSLVDKKQNTFLHKITDSNNAILLSYLINNNIAFDINKKNEKGETPLQIAVEKGYVEIFNLLVSSQKPDFSLVDNKNNTLLHVFAEDSGSVQILEYLLKHSGIDINARNKNGETPLMQAVYHFNYGAFRLLLKNGADITLKDNYDGTLMHYVAYSRNVKLLKYVLYNYKLDINAKAKDGSTPLMVCAKKANYEEHFKFMNLLIANGAKTDEKNNKGENIFDILEENKEQLEYFKTNNKFNEAVLVADIVSDDEDIDDFFDNSIVKIKNTPAQPKKTFLQMVKDGDLQAGYKGYHPLIWAVMHGELEAFKYMLDNGANLQQIQDYTSDGSLMRDAVNSGNLEIIKILIEKGVNVNSQSIYFNTPIMYAARKGNLEAFKLLQEKGANTQAVDYNNQNLMYYAAIGDNVEIIKILIEKGIEVDSKDKYGYTPVMCAAEYGKLEALKLLVENGANIKAVSNENKNLLHFALSEPEEINIEMVKYLVEQGIDVNLIADSGEIPIEMASDRQDVMDILKSGISQLPANDKTAELPKQDVSSDDNSHPQQTVTAPQSNSNTNEPKDVSKDNKNPSIEVKISGMSIFKNILISIVITTVATIIAAAILFAAAAPLWIIAPVAVVTFTASCIGMSYFKYNLSADEKAKSNLNQSKASPANSQSAANEKSFRKDQDVSQQQAQNNSKNIG